MSLHPAVAERLDRLAPDQRAAATAPPGPVLCVAPAGSGKTTTLVARVAWLVATGAPTDSVTAVTFNRRAAQELVVRLDEALRPLGVEPGAVRVRTFHALGREILRDAGMPVDRLVDRRALLRELFGSGLGTAQLRSLDDAISRSKLDRAPGGARATAPTNQGMAVAAARSSRRAAIAERSARYEHALRERDALDLDDLVVAPLRLLERDETLRARWRHRTAHLLVDEVQDLDRTQLRLALLLEGPDPDVFFVGDDDQTIYAWRLADVRRVLGLAAGLPGLRRVDLTTNYRCPAAVVTRAVRLVEHNRERFRKSIRARADASGRLALAPDGGDEVARARSIFATWPPDDSRSAAVLARTNRELIPYAAVALERGMSYRAEDDGLLLDDPLVDATLDAAERASARYPALPLLAVLDRVRRAAPAAASRVAVAVLAWAPPYRDVVSLRAAVADARARRLALRADDATLVLATVHGTKGLEFDDVSCVGLDDGTFPSARTLDEADDPDRVLEEERRLAYVAWTRARRSLVLVYDPAVPSRFLTEAFDPAELLPVASPPRRTAARTPASTTARARTSRLEARRRRSGCAPRTGSRAPPPRG